MLSVDTEQLGQIIGCLSKLAADTEDMSKRLKTVTTEIIEDEDLKLFEQSEKICNSVLISSDALCNLNETLQSLSSVMATVATEYEQLETENKNAVKRITALMGNIKPNIDASISMNSLPTCIDADVENNQKKVELLVNESYEELQATNIAAIKSEIYEEYAIKSIKTF